MDKLQKPYLEFHEFVHSYQTSKPKIRQYQKVGIANVQERQLKARHKTINKMSFNKLSYMVTEAK